MIKLYIPLFAIVVLLLLRIIFSFDFEPSVSSGWHTTVYPSEFLWKGIIVIILLFVTVAYWLSSNKADKINWALFCFHFLVTIPTLIFIKFPGMFLDLQQLPKEDLFRNIALRIKLIPLAYWTLMSGQVLFFIYFIRTVKASWLR